KSDVWKIRLIENRAKLDFTRFARKHKILVHKYLAEYDYSIYVDGKIKIIGDFTQFIMKYSKGNPLLCFPHYERDCLYEEMEACVQLKKDDEFVMREQVTAYKQEGYPTHDGLIDSACLIRNHRDAQLCRVMEDWWNEVMRKSKRDQISFGYACWKNNFCYDICDLFIYDNDYTRIC
ncbi:DUF616 domain-containing protein, partial [Lachnospiraceae bacterium OttesenSCG-928-D06]|nr:DUF616 domain-containing protein [Lachnospiraceae bacterium OttesenSCG-928-D06]